MRENVRFPERRRFPKLPRPLRFLLVDLAELTPRQAYIVVSVVAGAAWFGVALVMRGCMR